MKITWSTFPARPSFYFRQFAAPAGRAVEDEAAWAIANRVLDDFLRRDALRVTLPPKLGEAAFRRYQLGQWVGHDDAWRPELRRRRRAILREDSLGARLSKEQRTHRGASTPPWPP